MKNNVLLVGQHQRHKVVNLLITGSEVDDSTLFHRDDIDLGLLHYRIDVLDALVQPDQLLRTDDVHHEIRLHLDILLVIELELVPLDPLLGYDIEVHGEDITQLVEQVERIILHAILFQMELFSDPPTQELGEMLCIHDHHPRSIRERQNEQRFSDAPIPHHTVPARLREKEMKF